jgi:hypothetical protein
MQLFHDRLLLQLPRISLPFLLPNLQPFIPQSGRVNVHVCCAEDRRVHKERTQLLAAPSRDPDPGGNRQAHSVRIKYPTVCNNEYSMVQVETVLTTASFKHGFCDL